MSILDDHQVPPEPTPGDDPIPEKNPSPDEEPIPDHNPVKQEGAPKAKNSTNVLSQKFADNRK